MKFISGWGDFYLRKPLRNLSNTAILLLPLYPPAGKGVLSMSSLLNLILAVAADIIGYFICKWLDGRMNRR